MNSMERMNEAMQYLEDNPGKELDYDVVCKITGMSKSSFQKTFLFFTNMTFSEYVRVFRMNCAANDLQNEDTKIIEIAGKYGYDSAAAFSRSFHQIFNCSPSEFRKKTDTVKFSPIRFQLAIGEAEMTMNDKAIVRVEEHRGEKVICFRVDCYDAEEAAWSEMAKWCKQHIPDRTARRYVGLAPMGHHPEGESHQDAEEHVKHPYEAMMFLLSDEAKKDTLYGMSVEDAPQGLFLINDVALNQYDAKGNMDMALSMIKASEAFVEFVKQTNGYEFDMGKGVFYEEHIFSDNWFKNGGTPDGFKMWVPVIKK